jgi:pimeloyl-ACP methyl ester carboxylesterase
MTDREYDVYLHEMMQAIRARPRLPVLLYAHGGLVTLQGALENDTVIERAITAEGEYYPIFVNWHASLPTTLGEHLCCVRQGERESWAPLTMPLAFLGGLANSVLEAIPSWGAQVGDGTVPLRRSPQSYDIVYDSLRREFGQPNQIRVSRGDVTRLPPIVQRVGGMTVGSPFRAFGSPFVAGFGAPAWENMLRRIHLMFRADDERSTALSMAKQGAVDYRAPSGALGMLMDSLSALVAEERDSRTITLIGHSMGAIVMNELLQRYPKLPVTDIVYMAPASSVRDLETSVIPFMRENRKTRFYILTLHPRADMRERALGTDFLPRGSLLEWLDDYLTKPRTRLDRRLGKWRNVIDHHYIFPPEVRGRVSIKAFGIGDSTVTPYGNRPTRHGQFNDPRVPFWRRSFWEPASPR